MLSVNGGTFSLAENCDVSWDMHASIRDVLSHAHEFGAANFAVSDNSLMAVNYYLAK